MAAQDCQYSQYKQNGLEQSLLCSLTGKYCTKQRYCPTQRRLINTDDWQTCTQLKKEELQMANKKSTTTKKKKVEVANIKETKTEKSIVEKVAEPIVKTEDTVVAEVKPTVEKAQLKVATYEVILAKPTYFIINKNGENVTINKLNNYKKGDIVTL